MIRNEIDLIKTSIDSFRRCHCQTGQYLSTRACPPEYFDTGRFHAKAASSNSVFTRHVPVPVQQPGPLPQ